MVRLDVGTLAFSTAVVAVAVAATTAAIAASRGRGPERLCFPGAAAVYGVGVLAIITWPRLGPALIAGNALVMASTCAVHAGICAYAGRRPPLALYLLSLAAVIAGYILSIYGEVGGVTGRIILISGLRLPFGVHAFWLLRRSRSLRSRFSCALLQVISAFLVLLNGIRIADAAVGSEIFHFPGAMGIQAAYFLGVSIFYMGLAIAFILICGEREEAYLRDRIAAQTEDLKAAKEVAENALAAKSRFLAATGHDLRQAAHALNMLLAAADCELAGRREQESELVDLTGDMSDVIASMTEQLNALLEMARLEGGVVIPEFRDVPLQEVMDRIKSQFRRQAIANDVDLRFIDSSVVIRSDAALLQRVLANLVANAIKFGPGGRVLVGCRRRKGEVMLEVWDEGAGIPAEHLERIFDEYHQVKNPNRARKQGIGLGLAIARRTAELLGARISVSSQVGKGSGFALRLGRA